MKEIGTDPETGLTIGKIPLNKRTGMPQVDSVSKRSSLKNEAVHIAVLGKALLKNDKASHIYSENEAIEILTKKVSTLISFTGRNRLHR